MTSCQHYSIFFFNSLPSSWELLVEGGGERGGGGGGGEVEEGEVRDGGVEGEGAVGVDVEFEVVGGLEDLRGGRGRRR